jgi:hypothetical protein
MPSEAPLAKIQSIRRISDPGLQNAMVSPAIMPSNLPRRLILGLCTMGADRFAQLRFNELDGPSGLRLGFHSSIQQGKCTDFGALKVAVSCLLNDISMGIPSAIAVLLAEVVLRNSMCFHAGHNRQTT